MHIETVRRRKDGTEVECSVTATPRRDARGGLVGVTSITRDISASNQAARKTLERETQFRALLDQGIAGISILSETGHVEYMNEGFASLCGYTADDLIGRPFLEFIAEPDRPRVQERFVQTLAGQSRPIEARIITRGGPLQSVLAHATCVTRDGRPAVIASLVDITERKVAEHALQRTNRLLRTITQANEVLVRSRTEDELTQGMCDVVVKVGGYQSASITLLHADGGIEIAATSGARRGGIHHLEDGWPADTSGDGAAGAIRRGTTWTGDGCAFVPLKHGARAFGSLGICDAEPGLFADDEIALLTEMGNDLAYGVVALRAAAERQTFTERLQRSMEDAIAALAATVEMRDPYTAGHQRHVAELAAAIAREMGLDESRVHAIRLASVIHDIGKIKIPAELLTKPGTSRPSRPSCCAPMSRLDTSSRASTSRGPLRRSCCSITNASTAPAIRMA